MTRLAFIVSTGDPTTDKVLVGVMGHLSPEYGFTPIEEFKNIPAVSVLTPELLSSNPDSIFELEVDDSNLPAVKALMASRLQERWEAMYNKAVASMPGRAIAHAAIFGERDKVVAACEACTNVFQEDAPWIGVAKPFQDNAGSRSFSGDDEDGEYDDAPQATGHDSLYLCASDMMLSASSPWTSYALPQAPPHVGQAPMDSIAYPFLEESRVTTSQDLSASGVGVLQVRFHGDSVVLASILNQLPSELSSILYGHGNSENPNQTMKTGFAEIAWNAPRPVNAATLSEVTTAGAAAPAQASHQVPDVLHQTEQTGLDDIRAAYERGRIVGRVEGYSSGYEAKATEIEQEGEGEDPPAEAPTAG